MGPRWPTRFRPPAFFACSGIRQVAEELKTMFDNLSDRLGGVFDKLKGRGVWPEKVGTTFSVRSNDHKQIAARAGEHRAYV